MGLLQGLLGKNDKFAIEADDLQKYYSFNADGKDDRIEYDTIGYQQIACQNDGVGATFFRSKSYHQG